MQRTAKAVIHIFNAFLPSSGRSSRSVFPSSTRRLHACPSRASSRSHEIGADDGKSVPKRFRLEVDRGSAFAEGNSYRVKKVVDSSFLLSVNEADVAKPATHVELPRAQHVETLIFDAFKNVDGKVAIAQIFSAVTDTGLPLGDPRLRGFMEILENLRVEMGLDSIDTMVLDESQLKRAVTGSLVLLSRAFRNQFRIPDFPDLRGTIDQLYWACQSVSDGQSAQYIPQLAKVNRDYWGVSLCTVDGQRYSIGDADVAFTIQSCSKPLSYGLALSELGRETVHKYVGLEPSGRMFNSLTLDYNSKPHNPMINAGAMVICGVLMALVHPEMDQASKFEYVRDYLKALAGNEFVGFSNSVFLSEKASANRNSAIAYHLMDNKCFPAGTRVRHVLEFYFQCCSFEVDCHSLSVIASTLANGGICPVTGQQVLKADAVRDVLTLMHSCGMYDYSGQFAFYVGLPAKSGVSGATMVVVPGVMGLATFSPPLDSLGNSVKGLKFCKDLVSVYNFHRFEDPLQGMRRGVKDPRQHEYDLIGLRIVNLLFAAAAGDIAAVRRHFLSGIDVDICDYDGRSALHLAAAAGHEQMVKFLLKSCGANGCIKDRWGNMPVDDAESFGHTKVAAVLREAASGGGGRP